MDESVVGLVWAFLRKQSSRYRKSSNVLTGKNRTLQNATPRQSRSVHSACTPRTPRVFRLTSRRRHVLLESVLLLSCLKQASAKGSRVMVVHAGRHGIPHECVDDLLLGYSELTVVVVSCWMSQVDFPFANDIYLARTHPTNSSKDASDPESRISIR